MNLSSYSDKIDAFQTTVDNLEPDLPKYPGVSDLFAGPPLFFGTRDREKVPGFAGVTLCAGGFL